VPRLSLLAALAATAVTMLAFALVSQLLDAAPPSGDRPQGVALSADDRAVLQAPQVRRGVPAVAPDPTVDLTDPEAVTRRRVNAWDVTGDVSTNDRGPGLLAGAPICSRTDAPLPPRSDVAEVSLTSAIEQALNPPRRPMTPWSAGGELPSALSVVT
jgi:hypothetical protein